MKPKPVNLLLIEDNLGDKRLIEEMIGEIEWPRINLIWADRLTEPVAQVEKKIIDLIMLDLFLPDSSGLHTLTSCLDQWPFIPIVVISGMINEEIGMKVIQAGAQDFLSKNEITSKNLARTILYAIERYRHHLEWHNQALHDSLTGLNNRRSLAVIGERIIMSARADNADLSFLMIDIDGLKKINDTYGHQAGDQAIKAIAEILKKTFRSSDLVVRYGGDEFVVLAFDTDEKNYNILKNRLVNNLHAFNQNNALPFKLRVSVGVAFSCWNNNKDLSMDQMLKLADSDLYQQKSNKENKR
ncbi:diguanylate cyclase response regulator [bacterium]|nr:diguanylate cyclase response regulator [bacterium]